jgi:hypothetical protein
MSIIEFRPQGSPSFDEAVPQGQPIVETPLQEIDPNHVVITQRYMQRIEAYKNPPENDRIPKEILPSLNVLAYHCYDGPRTPVNGTSIVEFDRIWATVPKSFYDKEEYTVAAKQPSSVGLYKESLYISTYKPKESYINRGIVVTGNQITLNAKTKRDFFLVGKNSIYSSTLTIPTRDETLVRYYDWSNVAVGTQVESSDFISLVSRAPFVQVPITSGIVIFPSLTIAFTATASNPFLYSELYATQSLSGSYIYGNSKLIKYIGNIYERRSIDATT